MVTEKVIIIGIIALIVIIALIFGKNITASFGNFRLFTQKGSRTVNVNNSIDVDVKQGKDAEANIKKSKVIKIDQTKID